VRRHQIQVVAIGNGTACRETEEVVSELIASWTPAAAARPCRHLSLRRHRTQTAAPPVSPTAESVPAEPPAPVVVAETVPTAAAETASNPIAAEATAPEANVTPGDRTGCRSARSSAGSAPTASRRGTSGDFARGFARSGSRARVRHRHEAGASVYSASPVGREEFPDFDATLRGTISIGRRLQDPLSELVKIDPQHVGVGLYQHDVHPKYLRESLDAVIESCVNTVGVDLNTPPACLYCVTFRA